MYGTQNFPAVRKRAKPFENDVKMYGTQTLYPHDNATNVFENDVKMYGTQTTSSQTMKRLRV